MSGIEAVIATYKKTLALFVPASILPAVAGLVNLVPPRPDGLIPVTIAYELVIILIAYAAFRRANFRVLKRVLISGLAASVVLFLAYVVVSELFVYDLPNGDRLIAGFECSEDAKLVYGDVCPFLSAKELAEGNYEPSLFTASSRAIVTLALNFLWFGFFLAIPTCVGSFAANEARVIRQK